MDRDGSPLSASMRSKREAGGCRVSGRCTGSGLAPCSHGGTRDTLNGCNANPAPIPTLGIPQPPNGIPADPWNRGVPGVMNPNAAAAAAAVWWPRCRPPALTFLSANQSGSEASRM